MGGVFTAHLGGNAGSTAVILENQSFVAFIPFAAEVPFEVWIMPKRHQADFGQISNEEKSDLAQALHDILARLYTNYRILTITTSSTLQLATNMNRNCIGISRSGRV